MFTPPRYAVPRVHKIKHVNMTFKRLRDEGFDMPVTSTTKVAGQRSMRIDQLVMLTSGTDPRTVVTDFPEVVTFEDAYNI